MNTPNTLATFDAEVTDTFGGETNYGWIRRASFQAPRDTKDATLVRMGKAALGMTGQRCVRSTYGDTIQLDVVGACIRAFITFRDEPTND